MAQNMTLAQNHLVAQNRTAVAETASIEAVSLPCQLAYLSAHSH